MKAPLPMMVDRLRERELEETYSIPLESARLRAEITCNRIYHLTAGRCPACGSGESVALARVLGERTS